MKASEEQAEGRTPQRRLFVGLRFPETVQLYLRRRGADWKACQALHGGRFANDFHVTLKFLGNVEQARIDRLAQALASAYRSVGSFAVTAGPLGAFPNPAGVSVLWWGIDGGHADLVECAARTEEALEPVGFDRERRRFLPHITLSRFRRAPDLRDWIGCENERIRSGDATSFPPFAATALALVESELRRDGALYTPLASYPLS